MRRGLSRNAFLLLLLAGYVVLGLASGSISGQTIVTVVLFFVILGGLILIHEFGHFVVARAFRVRVLEFGVGFPPRARVLRAKGETTYTLNWLPIGGFVKLEGEDGDSADDPRSFSAQRLATKIAILAAGAVMNLVLAWAILYATAVYGDPAVGVTVPYVDPGSPAAAAGLQAGDTIERVDGRVFGSGFPPDSEDILTYMRSHAGDQVALTVRHADGSVDVRATTLRSKAELSSTKGPLGIGKAGAPVAPVRLADRVTYGPIEAASVATSRSAWATGLIVAGMKDLAVNLVTRPTEPPQAAGPVGIAQTIGTVFWGAGLIPTLYLAAVLSANLAVFNILPLPPLDGGRILMIVLKRMFGTRISLRAERLTYLVGFVVVFAFIIWVTAFDIIRGIGGGG